jgi:hypothetical protein
MYSFGIGIAYRRKLENGGLLCRFVPILDQLLTRCLLFPIIIGLQVGFIRIILLNFSLRFEAFLI